MAMTFMPLRTLIAVGLAVCLSHPAPGLWGQTETPTEITVVAHPAVPVDDLTVAELRLILLGEKLEWRDGLKIVIVLRAPISRERDAVMRICEVTEAQFRQNWIGRVFRNEAPGGPKVVYTMESALEQVSSGVGAITLVGGPVTAKTVKVLKVDGKLPGQAGYPIRSVAPTGR
jgi:hypothetical protein